MHSPFPIRAMRLGNIRITADKPPKGANSLSKVTKTTDFLRGFIMPERAIPYIGFWGKDNKPIGPDSPSSIAYLEVFHFAFLELLIGQVEGQPEQNSHDHQSTYNHAAEKGKIRFTGRGGD